MEDFIYFWTSVKITHKHNLSKALIQTLKLDFRVYSKRHNDIKKNMFNHYELEHFKNWTLLNHDKFD